MVLNICDHQVNGKNIRLEILIKFSTSFSIGLRQEKGFGITTKMHYAEEMIKEGLLEKNRIVPYDSYDEHIYQLTERGEEIVNNIFQYVQQFFPENR